MASKQGVKSKRFGSIGTEATNSPSSSTTSSFKQFQETSNDAPSSPASSSVISKSCQFYLETVPMEALKTKENVTVTVRFRPLKGNNSTNNFSHMASFSGRGPSMFSKNTLKPDFAAPGVNILAAWTGNDRKATLKRKNLCCITLNQGLPCHVHMFQALQEALNLEIPLGVNLQSDQPS